MAQLTAPFDLADFAEPGFDREPGTDPAHEAPPRTALIRRVRQEIRLGLYETEDKIDAVVDRLYADL